MPVAAPFVTDEIRVRDHETARYDFVAPAGGHLEVRLVSPQGLPFPFVPLRVLNEAGEDADWLSSYTQPTSPETDAAGAWRWYNLPAGPVTIVPGPGAVVDFSKQVEVVPNRTTRVTIEIGG